MSIPLITFTGLDTTAEPQWVRDTLRHNIKADGYSAVEFGILRSPKVDQSPRYPNMRAMRPIMAAGKAGDFAFHLCGRYAQLALSGQFAELCDIVDFDMVGRVQVNIQYEETDSTILKLWRFSQQIGKPVIMQWRKPLFEHVPAGVYLLQDLSGGNGRQPDQWFGRDPMALARKTTVGYAGGLSPVTIDNSVRKIERASEIGNYWLDCESGVRTADTFSMVKADQMLRALRHLLPSKFHPETHKHYGSAQE